MSVNRLTPDEKKEPEPRNRHRVQAMVRTKDGNFRPVDGLVMQIRDENPNLLKATKKQQDKREKELLKQMFKPLGNVEEIPKAKDIQTPDLRLNFREHIIPIEVKFIERDNIEDNLTGANSQIEAYGGPETLGFICLVFRNHRYFPNMSSLVEPDQTTPFTVTDRVMASKFRSIVRNNILGKRRMVLLFQMLPVDFCSFYDSYKGCFGFFSFKGDDMERWLTRLGMKA